jgi:serine/threonine-protein kinase
MRGSGKGEDDEDHAISQLGDEPERTETAAGAQRRLKPSVALVTGAIIDNRYQIEAVLGQGGSGAVFRAWDRVLGEAVAMKILHPERAEEKSWIKRLAREVKVARAIRHPNVCRVFDLGHADGHWFVTMELATGGTLRQLLREESGRYSNAGRDAEREQDQKQKQEQEQEQEHEPGRDQAPGSDRSGRPLGERLVDARALCAGLAAIHAVGIIHRDVTPQNVLRMKDGRLVLSDFGLAIEGNDNTTIHGGTPAYMPPEALMGERSDQRSDVWQLGTILHEILFGRRPEFERKREGLVMKSPLSPEASAVEEELARLCGDCLLPDRAQRPPTAMAVAGRLAAAEVARPRPWPVRAWNRGRGFLRAHPSVLVAAGILVVGAAAFRGVQFLQRPSLCRGAERKLEGVWDGGRQAAIEASFRGTGKPYAEEAFAGVRRGLDEYARAWTGMYREACEATQVRGEQSAEVLDLRMSCLQDRLGGVKALTDVLVKADGRAVGSAITAVNALPEIARCGDVKLLRSVVQPPEDPSVRFAVDRLRGQLSEVRALFGSGRFPTALRKATALARQVEQLEYLPLLAEVLTILGHVQAEMGDLAAGVTNTERALWAAESSRHDAIAAEVRVNLIGWLAKASADPEETKRLGREADAALRRIGGHARMEGWLFNNLGNIHSLAGRHAESLEDYKRAAALKEKALSPSDPDIALTLGNIANELNALGRRDEALAYNDRALAILTAGLGATHPEVATHLSNRGEILHALGRYGDARRAYSAALATWEREFGPKYINLGYPLTGIGESYRGEKKPERAIAPLERALRIRATKSDREPPRLAETQFALAQALWDSGGDTSRAISLAGDARKIYAEIPSLAAKRTEIDGWLTRARSTRQP